MITQTVLRQMDRVSTRLGRTPKMRDHLRVGKQGEEAAFFHLQREGYTMVARNWRSHKLRGDLDLVGWQDGFLCFVEVKTRRQRDSIAAEFAVDEEKRRMLRRMARAYLRRYEDRDRIPVRFDVISVYLTGANAEFELFQGVFSWH
ncbi:MAG: YraN family protein [Acidobacteriaceae bacterium]